MQTIKKRLWESLQYILVLRVWATGFEPATLCFGEIGNNNGYFVKTSQPFFVIAMVCLRFDESFPSLVITVHLSLRVLQNLLPSLIIGLIVKVIPSLRTTLGISLVRKLNIAGLLVSTRGPFA